MRISVPATLIGSLGSLVQAVIGALNALFVTERGFTYGASFDSTTNLAAGGSEQVFSVAQNPNGAIVWAADVGIAVNVGDLRMSLHAHTVAPTVYTDGDVILSCLMRPASAAGLLSANAQLPRAVLIPAGKGLWWLDTITAEATATRKVLYTLL